MPPVSSAVLYEIDDIVTAIEHIVISTLEDLGKDSVSSLDKRTLNNCRVLLQHCVGIKINLDDPNRSTTSTPVQGANWTADLGGMYVNEDLTKVNMPDWLRRELVSTIVPRDSRPIDKDLCGRVGSELYTRLRPLCTPLEDNMKVISGDMKEKLGRLSDRIKRLAIYS